MDRIDSLKYMDIDSELQDLFNSKDSVFLKYIICIVGNRCFIENHSLFLLDKTMKVSLMIYLAQFLPLIILVIYERHLLRKIKKQHVPRQTIWNKLEVFHLPHEFRDIRRLEKVLIARRLLFKKATILPKCESLDLKGATCNVPIDVADTCNTLSHASDSNGLVIVKL